ncbi:DUF3078 domain-containing protein [Capnocytophaga sp. ARDL2]|uniref:DUF3078 domain-containing protein n=1 Tax=Capnocytophaga sp. ARDL2 TaxID=3238809 RepID=UPI003558DA7B
MKIKSLFYFLLILVFNQNFAQEIKNDSLEIPRKQLSIDEFYRNHFSVFDTLKVHNDTLFVRPIVVERKTFLTNTEITSNQSGGYNKVTLNEYQVVVKGKSNKLSYFQTPKILPLVYDNRPMPTEDVPFDYWSEERSFTSYWKYKNTIGIDMNQGSFVNWSAGGYNSISGIMKGHFQALHEKGRIIWQNDLKINYGVNKQEEREMRKTEDVIALNSTFGYRTSVNSRWYYSSKMTFNSQVANGYAYPNITDKISTFFAPAYLFLGIGAEYASKNNKLQLYTSPATLKSTFVLDQTLANSGAFGVKGAVYNEEGALLSKGKRSKNELGILLTSQYKTPLMKNVLLDTKCTLYTDYLHNFGNIDIDWHLSIEMKVNNFIKATLSGQLIYDDDIKNKRTIGEEQITEGPKPQIKQLLGVGMVFSF